MIKPWSIHRIYNSGYYVTLVILIENLNPRKIMDTREKYLLFRLRDLFMFTFWWTISHCIFSSYFLDYQTSLLRRLQAQTLPDETQSIGKKSFFLKVGKVSKGGGVQTKWIRFFCNIYAFFPPISRHYRKKLYIKVHSRNPNCDREQFFFNISLCW